MKKPSRISQISAEFIFLVGTAFVIMVIFAITTEKQVDDFTDKMESVFLEDITFKVQNEISIAARVEDGYSRVFSLPERLDGKINYTISIKNTTVIAESKNHQYFLLIPMVNGNLRKGDNTINKTNGIIYINE